MNRYSKQEHERELARKFDRGEGVSISFGDGEKVNYFFTNRVEGIKARSRQAIGDLEVEISSTQTDDEQLLKKLHTSL
jgi:predicted ATP-grasp superfamily ATP-dependent carboligase